MSPRVVDLGELPAGAIDVRSVEVVNYASETLTLTGGAANCSCVTWQESPVSVPPHGRATFTLTTRLPSTPGRFQQRAHLYAGSDGRLYELPFSIVARVVEPPQASPTGQ